MSATVKTLNLFDLLLPQFLAGFQFPDYIDKYLSLLAVADLNMASDDNAVLYTGTVFFPSAPGNPAVLSHAEPDGKVFDFNDITLQFRLRVPRAGSSQVQGWISAGSTALQSLADATNALGTATATPSEYPGVAFELELLLTSVTLHLGSSWKPALYDDATFQVTLDPSPAHFDVRFLLPKVLFSFSQGQDYLKQVSFHLESWGDAGFDAPHDLAEGECVTMDPPLAIHTSGRVAFGVDDVILDLSPNGTPPEILAHYGTDESFEGIFIKALQFYYCDRDKDTSLNFMVQDALISFKGEVSLEAEFDLLLPDKTLGATIRSYDGRKKLPCNPGHATTTATSTDWSGGSVKMTPTSVLYVQVRGGMAPFTCSVRFTPDSGPTTELWKDPPRQADLTPLIQSIDPLTNLITLLPIATQPATLVITVTDSSATPQVYTNTLTLNISNPPPTFSAGAAAVWTPTGSAPSGIPPEDRIQFTPSSTGTVETLTIAGTTAPQVTVDTIASTLNANNQLVIDVQPGTARAVMVSYPAGPMPGVFPLYFAFGEPSSDALESNYYGSNGQAPDPPTPPDDCIFPTNKPPNGTPGGSAHAGADALRYWAATALDLSKPITIVGHTSNTQHPDQAPHSQAVSLRRAQIAQTIIHGSVSGANVTSATGAGQTSSTTSLASDDVATVTGTAKATPSYMLSGVLSRPGTATPQPAKKTPAPTPPGPPSNKKPPVLRRLSIRVRLQRNTLVLAEIGGEIDFETRAETKLRNQTNSGASPTDTLGLAGTPAAAKNPNPAPGNPNDGLVDFTLNVTYDPATHDLTETLTLGAAPADLDGLLHMTNPSGSWLKNMLGSILILTPILEAVTTALDPKSAGDWKAITADFTAPALLGALNVIQTTQVTLYGGELKLRENIPGGGQPATFSSASLTFDYDVSFNVNAGPIQSSKPLKVRYKAVGVALDFRGSTDLKFVLDTSKGYSLDLSDPTLFKLPGTLGNILKIAAARIAQFNPLTLEIDAVIKADLGIITVDKFKIKIPLDGGLPTIVPSGVRVNIPSTLVGNGSVAISSGSVSGSLDLTLVPLKLRVAASVGIDHVHDPVNTAREATAFFLGLEIDFPTPIILGDTGLGLFGLFGLFGMHYDRVLVTVPPNDPVGPDLKWLKSSGGAPYMLSVGGTTLWDAKIDNWAFGVGALLGTLDGYLLNLRGMVILELPGPRILITVNAKIITELPGVSSASMDVTDLDVGIIGILDLDFNLDQITLGVLIDLEIDSLLSIQVPIQIFFNWDHSADWHVWIGTFQAPASANILNIVRGGGYFMVGGQDISPFPPGSSLTLPGVAVAMGVSASVVWGSESAGIYLKVALSADFGVSFTPKLYIVGHVHLEGELRLLVVSIGASGDFLLEAPNPVYLEVHICGHVKLFFFKISACVDFKIGATLPPPAPPPLISKMYLQSFAPVIASGQGGERPIDASLGNAIVVGGTNQPPIPIVPIDSVPVLQMQFGVDASGITTFTAPIGACPTYPGGTGVSIGGGRSVQYALKNITITPALPAGVKPPAVWRPNKPASDTSQTRVDLALFSRNPNVSMSALERSTSLTGQLTSVWSGTCGDIAKPTCVFWAFCDQRIGPSPNGWTLYGTPWPDAPKTKRDAPVAATMVVEQPSYPADQALLLSLGPLFGKAAIQPAQVIGTIPFTSSRTNCWRAVELPELIALALKTPRLDAPGPIAGGVAGAVSGTPVGASPGTLTGGVAGAAPGFLPGTTPGVVAGVTSQAGLAAEGSFGTLTGFVVGGTETSPGTNGGGASTQPTADSLLLNSRWLRFDTGRAQRVRLLLGLNANVVREISVANPRTDLVIRELKADNSLVSETPLRNLHPVTATAANNLPTTWTDPAGPWSGPLSQVVLVLSANKLAVVFVEIKPHTLTAKIEVAIKGPDPWPIPSVVVGAIEACPTSDVERYQNAVQIQQSAVSTIQGYLNGGTPVPLLQKNTTYTITASYDVNVTEANGSSSSHPGVTQAFQFQTDNQPPPKLDPWVLCSSPDLGEQHVFYGDPVHILFNDNSIIQLFSQYGYQLKMNLHAADGLPEPTAAPVSTTAVNGVGQATYDSLRALIAAGVLPCIGSTTQQYQNQLFTAPVTLRPLMAYTLDLVTDPLQTPPANAPITPLYRRAFSTSKYASMAALAADLGVSVVKHRALKSKLGFPSTPGKTVVPDHDIQDAFMAAGEQALPPPTQNSIVIYWAQTAGTGPYHPHAVVLDCTEPLWRARAEPSFQLADANDPSFEIVTITSKTALEVSELSGTSVSSFIVSPSGTRTVALLANGVPQGTLTLALHRPASTFYGLADDTKTIVALPIGPTAPWENDHV